MGTITLTHTADGWLADFGSDTDVLAAFGTSVIPTAYTASAPAAVVVAGIKRLNPGYTVAVY